MPTTRKEKSPRKWWRITTKQKAEDENHGASSPVKSRTGVVEYPMEGRSMIDDSTELSKMISQIDNKFWNGQHNYLKSERP